MSPADGAWIALGVGVGAWDVLAAETLSDAFARYHQRRPWLVRAAVALLVAHLLEVLPRRLDPFHGGMSLIRKVMPDG